MDLFPSFFFPAAAYLLGSIPFGLLIARGMGIDLRSRGSGNIGATNVTRVLGKGPGLLTLLADLGKGFAVVLACRTFFPEKEGDEFILALTGMAAVLGHCFPVFLGFRGGKGIATAAGVFLAVSPASLGVAALVFLVAAKTSGFVSLGSLLASVAVPAALHFFRPGLPLESMAWAIALLVWWKHRANIGRLLRGEELGWRRSGL